MSDVTMDLRALARSIYLWSVHGSNPPGPHSQMTNLRDRDRDRVDKGQRIRNEKERIVLTEILRTLTQPLYHE